MFSCENSCTPAILSSPEVQQSICAAWHHKLGVRSEAGFNWKALKYYRWTFHIRTYGIVLMQNLYKNTNLVVLVASKGEHWLPLICINHPGETHVIRAKELPLHLWWTPLWIPIVGVFDMDMDISIGTLPWKLNRDPKSQKIPIGY